MSLEGETNGHIFSEDKQFVAKLMYMTRKQLALPKEKGHSLYMLYLGSRSQLHPPLVDWPFHQESLYEDTLLTRVFPLSHLGSESTTSLLPLKYHILRKLHNFSKKNSFFFHKL